jgi:hypothetical protein
MTPGQERRLAAMIAGLTFGMATLDDPHKDWVGWLSDGGLAVVGSAVVVAAMRRAPYFKQSRFVKVTFAMFLVVLATDLAVTGSRGWRDEPPFLTALLAASNALALVAMLGAGRTPLRALRREPNR